MLVTIKGDPVGVISSPLTDTTRELKQPERSAFQARHAVFERAGRKLHRLVTRLVHKTGPLTQLAPRSWRNRPNWPGATGSGAGGKTDN